MNRFSPAAKLILVGGLIWISLAVAVLMSGLRSSQVPSAAAEVAMQMVVLSFPSSVGVGWLLNALQQQVNVPSGYGGILYAWVPFFMAGCLQLVGLIGLAGGLRQRP